MYKQIPLPRDAAIDQLCDIVNDAGIMDPLRKGHMDRDRANRTLDAFKAAFRGPIAMQDMPESADMHKSVSIATGLTYYDLRAPALNIFPTLTPIRNSIPRRQRPYAGDAFNYKVVSATLGSGIPNIGWVPEGRRAASMSYTTSSVTNPYATLGEEDSITEEALLASEGFEDEAALMQLRTMLRLFVKQEAALLNGNRTVSLATPANPTVTVGGSNGTLPNAIYSVVAVALSGEGYQNASLSSGVAQSLTITGNDGQQYILNGGSSNKSAGGTGAVSLGQNLYANVPPVPGASGYAWYVGTGGTTTLQAITGVNQMTISAPLLTGTQNSTAITANNSTNPYGYDGLLATGFKSGSGAYVNVFATGPAGTGTPLTAGGYGGSAELDTMFKAMWDNAFVCPHTLYVSSTGMRAIAQLTLTTSSMPLVMQEGASLGTPEWKATSQGVITWYYNPYSIDGGMKLLVRPHPFMTTGTILAWVERLPPWYSTNEIPTTAVVHTRMDTYAEVWPRVTRSQYYGIYSQETLSVQAPIGIGILANVANA
jgi:hypothetical protein